ncbi:cupin domain-containing protein [Caulobacter sp. 17J80-11]|uniref:cupin domain-containing protein n=1 Tax=Caulobacter sp. 17J80-11 TaxID=2763502 RepID=UPI0016538FE3|nr:cupin domain-containing protein [Caulobacter sp. 17J80-11]
MADPGEPLKFDLWDAMDMIGGVDRPFDVVFERGDLTLEFYKPPGADLQESTHTRDELYVVARGSARLHRGDEIADVEAGDALFVPAGATHRFDRLSENFATWVVFFGPEKAR